MYILSTDKTKPIMKDLIFNKIICPRVAKRREVSISWDRKGLKGVEQKDLTTIFIHLL